MPKFPYQNVILQTSPGGGWEINGSGPTPQPPITQQAIRRESAKIDVELVKAYKLQAAKEGRFIYELMEEALRDYLKK